MGIKAVDVSKRFAPGQPPILNDIQLDIQDGEFIALIGKSGSGKSSLLYILSTLETPTTGSVSIDGIETSKLRGDKLDVLRNEKIGFIFQFHFLLPEISALENVLMPARARNIDLAENKKRALELLARVGLKGKEHRKPRELSGGEQQRVAVARALIMKPKYLFADEPTGALDSINSENVIRLLENINKELKTTIILVTHEPEFAARAGRLIHMKDGRIENPSDPLRGTEAL